MGRDDQKLRVPENVPKSRGKRLTDDESRAELRRLLAWKRSILDGDTPGPFPAFAQDKFERAARRHAWDDEFRDDELLRGFRR